MELPKNLELEDQLKIAKQKYRQDKDNTYKKKIFLDRISMAIENILIQVQPKTKVNILHQKFKNI